MNAFACCRLLKGEGTDRGPLTFDELTRLQSQVDAWLSDQSPNAALELGGSMLHIRAALDMLKKCAKQGGKRGPGGAKDMDSPDPSDQLRKLQLQVCVSHCCCSQLIVKFALVQQGSSAGQV